MLRLEWADDRTGRRQAQRRWRGKGKKSKTEPTQMLSSLEPTTQESVCTQPSGAWTIETHRPPPVTMLCHVSRSVVSDSLWPHGLWPTRVLHPWDFPGKSTGVGCHCLLRLVSSRCPINICWLSRQILYSGYIRSNLHLEVISPVQTWNAFASKIWSIFSFFSSIHLSC